MAEEKTADKQDRLCSKKDKDVEPDGGTVGTGRHELISDETEKLLCCHGWMEQTLPVRVSLGKVPVPAGTWIRTQTC